MADSFKNNPLLKRYLLTAVVLLLHVMTFAQLKPNVLLILTDDQGWGDIGLHQNPWLETPNLDKLAKSGQEFTHCYATPLCAPTRAGLLTGRHHLSTGVLSVSKGLERMDTEETTLAELFKANGYHTGIFGKWHNGEHFPNRPIDQGFDEFLGFSAGHLSNYFNTRLEHNNATLRTNGYITDVLTDAALKFMADRKNQPFFCYLPYNAPHSPHQVPDRYFAKYKAKGLENELASIYGMVDNVDENVGRILRYLQKQRLEENTIVIFLSDNGPNGNRFNAGLKGIKGSVHEGGVRVPFFIRWKGRLKAGKVHATPVAHTDLYPTLSELCGLTAPPGRPLDGKSLAPLLLENGAVFNANRNLYTHVNFMEVPAGPDAGGFRNERYRFVYEKGEAQLYDLLQDPGQQNNLAATDKTLTDSFQKAYMTWFTGTTAGLQYNRPIVLSKRSVALPAYEAALSPGIRFKEGHGWAHDWVEKWNQTTDSLSWEINCTDPGQYRMEIEYLCKKEDTGSRILCTIGNQQKEVVVSKAFYPAQVRSPDRVPRKEAYEMKGWQRLQAGTFQLAAGRQTVRLKALHVQHNNVAEVRLVRLVPAR